MSEFLQQIAGFWRELGLNQRVSIVFSIFGVFAGMVALLIWTSRPSLRLLYGRLDSKDMAEVIAAAEEKEIPYRMGAGGSSIFVPGDQVYRLRMELAANGIPNGSGVGFEIFDRGNFGISDFVQRTNYIRAVQGELSRTISQLQGVSSARVMIVVPENRLLVTNEKGRATASVFIDTGGGQLATESVNSIRFLVANSVEGLLIDDVAVVDNHGNVLSEELRQVGVAGASSGQLKYRRGLEEYYAKKVETMLGTVVGPGNVVARVSVEVDSEASTVLEERFDPDSQVARSETLVEDTTVSNESRPRQTVGVTAKVPEEGETENSGSSNAMTTSQEVRKNKTIAYEINRSTIETVKNPGKITRISAAVFLAMRMDGEGENAEPLPRTEEELNSLKAMVANALGVNLKAKNSAGSLITLEEAVFKGLPAPSEEGFTLLQDRIMRWYEVLRNFIAVGVAVIMFLIFLRMVKRHRPEKFNFEIIPDSRQDGVNQARDVTPRVTPELLNSLILEKPENVSAALKTWAGTVSQD